MKPYHFLFFVGILVSDRLKAQVFDHVHQPSLESWAGSSARLSNGSLAVVGFDGIAISWFSHGTLQIFNSEGIRTAMYDHWVPGHELTEWYTVKEFGEDTLLIGGLTSPGCDFGPFQGLLTCWHDGQMLWEKMYGDQDFYFDRIEAIAIGENTILLSSFSKLLWVGHMGDSLTYHDLSGFGPSSKVTWVGDRYLVTRTSGVWLFNETGDILYHYPSSGVVAASPGTNEGYLILQQDGLIELDASLQPVSGLISITEDAAVALFRYDGNWLVETTDDVLILNDAFDLLGAHPLMHPDGFQRSTALLDGDEIFWTGSFHSGVIAAAIRSMNAVTGLQPSAPADVAIGGTTLSDIELTVNETPYIFTVSGSAWAEVWIRNQGAETLQELTLNVRVPSMCNAWGARYGYTDLQLAPEDSMLLTAGPFPFFHWTAAGLIDIELCIWAASPNDRIDANRTDNEGCGIITVPVSINEAQLSPSWSIHPNPFHDEFTVSWQNPTPTGMIEVYDMTGRIIHREALQPTTTQKRINLPAGSPGLFVVRTIDDQGKTYSRMVSRL